MRLSFTVFLYIMDIFMEKYVIQNNFDAIKGVLTRFFIGQCDLRPQPATMSLARFIRLYTGFCDFSFGFYPLYFSSVFTRLVPFLKVRI